MLRRKLASPINSDQWDRSPALAGDGLKFFFGSSRETGTGNLWLCDWMSRDDPFKSPSIALAQGVNSSHWDGDPFLSADGLTLLFASKRPKGEGDQDLWMSTRESADEAFRAPFNLGPFINTDGGESEPALSADGLTLLFSSDRPGGNGSWDIWISRITKDEASEGTAREGTR